MADVQKKRLLIVGAVALILIGWLVYYLAQNRPVKQELSPLAQNEIAAVELSEEVLKSLTPPPGAKPAELSEEVLKSLTPPSRYVIFER